MAELRIIMDIVILNENQNIIFFRAGTLYIQRHLRINSYKNSINFDVIRTTSSKYKVKLVKIEYLIFT